MVGVLAPLGTSTLAFEVNFLGSGGCLEEDGAATTSTRGAAVAAAALLAAGSLNSDASELRSLIEAPKLPLWLFDVPPPAFGAASCSDDSSFNVGLVCFMNVVLAADDEAPFDRFDDFFKEILSALVYRYLS